MDNIPADETLRSQAIRESMEYRMEHAPRESDFEPMVRVLYRCVKEGDSLRPPPCDFFEARKALLESPDIRRVDPNGFLLQAVERIEAEPAEFLPHDAKGFRFQRWGMDLLELRREDAASARVWGWLNWQQVLTREKELEKQSIHFGPSLLRQFRNWWNSIE